MNILSIGLDATVLEPNSKLARRSIEYGELVSSYDVVVPANTDLEERLSSSVSVYGVGGGNKVFKLFRLCVRVKKEIKKKSYDVISVQDTYFLALVALLFSKKYDIGLEVQVRGFEKYGGFRKLIARYVIPKADSIKTISLRLQEELVEVFGVKQNKITVAPIYTRIDDSLFRKEKKCNTKVVFISVSRLVPIKNIGLQIEALKDVVKEVDNVELWIVGDGPERVNLELKIKNYELDDKVKLLGWREDVGELYKKADVLVLSSSSEGWSKVVIEAANYALPVIMTNVGCAGEIIRNEENGLVIPVNDKKLLRNAMLDLINNRDKREILGMAAREEVQKRPSKEKIFSLYKESWVRAADSRNKCVE